MRFSIIVTTKGRPRQIREFLHALAQQRHTDFEVILGDQNEDDALKEELHSYGYTVSYHKLPPSGLSRARNLLLPHATGEIIALGDDDCLYPPELLATIAAAAVQHQDCGAFICDADAAGSEGLPGLKPEQVFRNAPSYALFLRRIALAEAGTFDENMGIGAPTPWQSGEETDMLLRIIALGHAVRRCPTSAPWHPAPDYAAPGMYVKTHDYGMGRMYLLAKHRFPLRFRLLNLLYPLAALPWDTARHGIGGARYRWAMFIGRVVGLLKTYYSR